MLLIRKRRAALTKPAEKRRIMQRMMSVLMGTAVMLLVASGVAFAVTRIGGPGDNIIYGTNNPDKIDGRSGDDTIYGRGGNDRCARGGYLVGSEGNDIIYGGAGDDDLFGGRN